MEYILAAIGMVLLFSAIVQHKKYCRDENRVPVAAAIRTYSVDEIKRYEGEIVVYYFIPKIQYSYRYDGKRYESSNIVNDKMRLDINSRHHADAMISKILSNPTAYICQDDPDDSILIDGVYRRRVSHIISLAVSGVLLMLIALLFGIYL